MKALTLTEYKTFEYAEVPDPECGPDEVLVAIRACGICGSDIHGMDGRTGRRKPPVVMGHEASGVIHEVGSEVSGWNVGDPVGFDSIVFCGKCDSCQKGQTNLCVDRYVIGVSCDDYRKQGAFADLLAMPAHVLHRLPEGVTFRQAAFGEPVAVAMHAVNRVNLQGSESGLVIGAGLIGLLVVQALKRAGAGKVWVSDLQPNRLNLARGLGADQAWNAETDDIVANVKKETNGRGADVVMEVVGAGPTIAQAVACVRNGGSIGCVGNLAAEVSLPLQQLVTREITLLGSCASSGEYADALQAIADGEIRVDPLISNVVGLSVGDEWFQRLYNDGKFSDRMKVILMPDETVGERH